MIPDAAIQAVAQKQLARYESEYAATSVSTQHLTWSDFAATAREDLETGWDYIQETLSGTGRLLLDEQCCEFGCNGGACESCTCCSAGYCISGVDFRNGGHWPEDDDLLAWLEIASEKNPVADKLRLALQELDICRRMLAESVPE